MSTGLEGKTLQRFIIFNGAGGNGKSLMDEYVCYILGEQYSYKNCPSALLTEKQTTNGNPAKFRLNKKRLVFIKEPEEKCPFQNNTIKELTGGNAISGRNLHSNDTEITLHITLISEANVPPKLSEEPTEAELRRFLDILFPHQFTDDKEKIDNIRYFKADNKYNEKKWQDEHKYELLHLLINNFKELRKNEYIFDIPQEVKDRTQKYLEKSFTIIPFFNENYIYSENNKDYLLIDDIISNYKSSEDYLNLNKIEKRKLNKTYFKDFFSKNTKFSKYYNERKKINGIEFYNIIVNYKKITNI